MSNIAEFNPLYLIFFWLSGKPILDDPYLISSIEDFLEEVEGSGSSSGSETSETNDAATVDTGSIAAEINEIDMQDIINEGFNKKSAWRK